MADGSRQRDLASQDQASQDQLVLGRALRALRHKTGMTQEQLATRAGTHSTHISTMENGHRGLRWHMIMRLLRAMNATARQFGAEIDRQAQRYPATDDPDNHANLGPA